MAISPIREFALKAVLWLPLAFVVWFVLAPLWILPSVLLAKLVLQGCWSEIFSAVTRGGDVLDAAGRVVGHADYLVSLSTAVQVVVPAGPDGPGGIGVLEPTINPMVYAYSLPLFGGLAMATPLSGWRRMGQVTIALAVIWLALTFGIVAESLKTIAFDSGANGAAAIAHVGLAPNAIALAYQFGYLILPAVVPVALWIGLNRGFIDLLVRSGGEPATTIEGQQDGSGRH